MSIKQLICHDKPKTNDIFPFALNFN